MVGIGYSLNRYKLGKLKFKKDCKDILYNLPFSSWNLDFID